MKLIDATGHVQICSFTISCVVKPIPLLKYWMYSLYSLFLMAYQPL